MLLNCDLGEGMPYDAQIMPLIDMANLACGLHAGSATLMQENILRAKAVHVAIGAHPSYPDKANFGRVSMQMDAAALQATLVYQISALAGLCQIHGTTLSYVKPHGALYNDMMADMAIFESVVEAVSVCSNRLKLMILSSPRNSLYEAVAAHYGIALLFELFADRNYTDESTLQPRSKSDAVIEEVDVIVARIRHYKEQGEIRSIHGKILHLECDTLCVHGDNEAALAVIAALREMLDH